VATYALIRHGFTLNVLTLLALTLAVGIVIDDAIVVLENIFRFIEEKTVAPFRRHRRTKGSGLAVLARRFPRGRLPPVAFMGGSVGRS